jgi:hypothetical protein
MVVGTTMAFLGANSMAIGAGAAIVGAGAEIIKTDIVNRAANEQSRLLKEDLDITNTEIAKQKKTALEKRKTGIDLQRRQLLGAGDNKYSLSGGLTNKSNTSNMEVLG